MKIVLMHRKMDHWTGYSPLADSCAAITSFSQNFLCIVYSKSYCHLTYGWIGQNTCIPSLGCRWWWPMGQTGDEMRGSLRSAHRQIGTTKKRVGCAHTWVWASISYPKSQSLQSCGYPQQILQRWVHTVLSSLDLSCH